MVILCSIENLIYVVVTPCSSNILQESKKKYVLPLCFMRASDCSFGHLQTRILKFYKINIHIYKWLVNVPNLQYRIYIYIYIYENKVVVIKKKFSLRSQNKFFRFIWNGKIFEKSKNCFVVNTATNVTRFDHTSHNDCI